LIVLAGGAFFVIRARRPSRFEAALTPEEEERLNTLELEATSQDRRAGLQ
jgi:hypothetical protein